MPKAKRIANAAALARAAYSWRMAKSCMLQTSQSGAQSRMNNHSGGGSSSPLGQIAFCGNVNPRQSRTSYHVDLPCRANGRKLVSSCPDKLTACQWRIVQVISEAAGQPLSRVQIAAEVGCCLQTVKRAMRVITGMDLVEVQHRFLANGGQVPNSYLITAKGQSSLAAGP